VKESYRGLAKKEDFHGETGTKSYSRWASMNQRCNDKNCKAYENYGGRGISVCNEWRRDYVKYRNFINSLHNANVDGY